MDSSLFSIFQKYPNVFVALSEKKDGSMRITESWIKRENQENRRNFFRAIGVDQGRVVSADLCHSAKVALVEENEAGEMIFQTDGLITKEKEVFLSVTVADCLPVFFYDFEKEGIGLAHAGRRGLAGGILESVVSGFKESFGSETEDILAGIGPGISVCHYEVGEEIARTFHSISPDVLNFRNEQVFLDLKETARIQLLRLGLKEQNIEIHPDCTFCLPAKYFSYRRDKPEEIKAMVAVMGIL